MSREEAIEALSEGFAQELRERHPYAWELEAVRRHYSSCATAALDALLASGHVVLREELECVTEAMGVEIPLRPDGLITSNGEPVYRLVKPQQGEPK